MKLRRTIKLQLECSPDTLKQTVELYTKAFNAVCSAGWEDKDCNGVSLHHKTYQAVREYLPAQLAVSSRMKATEALKSVIGRGASKHKTSCPLSRTMAVRYDARSYSAALDKGEVSILTVTGRKRFKVTVPEYFKRYLTWKRTTADLFLRKSGVFLHIVFEKEIADPVLTGNAVGIDRGINQIAVTSENKFYSGHACKEITGKYRALRKRLQTCGSASAKRHLKRLSAKENRYRADVNHCVSRSIVDQIPTGTVIVLEDLDSIRQTVRLRRKQRTLLHNWSFYQLQQFLIYKSAEKGIAVEFVDSRYTSQKCSVCGYISRANRTSQSSFQCKECGFAINADLNASRNIKQNYLTAISCKVRAVVNQPIVASDDAQHLLVPGRSSVTSPHLKALA